MTTEEREGDQDFRVRLIRVWNGADSVSGCIENVLSSGADRAEMLAMELRVLADERPK